jgi:Cu(I)/Ag(I) efflux system periplasmic protein CusF
MTKSIRQLAFALAAALSAAVHAQPAAAPMVVEPTAGEVRKVDKPNRKITLKHGEIRNLGMGPMAMEYDVKDGALIDKLKAGDKVRFKATYEGGKYIVTEIQPAK